MLMRGRRGYAERVVRRQHRAKLQKSLGKRNREILKVASEFAVGYGTVQRIGERGRVEAIAPTSVIVIAPSLVVKMPASKSQADIPKKHDDVWN